MKHESFKIIELFRKSDLSLRHKAQDPLPESRGYGATQFTYPNPILWYPLNRKYSH